jgi:hypothetical protein
MGKAESINSRFRVVGSPNSSFQLFFTQHPSTPVARNPVQTNPSSRQSRPCSRGSPTPVAAPNASPNNFLAGNRIRTSGLNSFAAIVLRDVAWGPSVKTGVNAPSYSRGVAALLVDSYPVFEGCG